MNLSTMQTRLRARINNPSVTDVADATLTQVLNEAYEDIWDRYRFHANRGLDTSLTTVAGTNSYTLPSNIEVVITVRDDTNGVRLVKIDRNQWNSLNQGTTRGKPTHYYIEFGTIYLNPNPDAAYVLSITNRKNYTALSGASDTPALPTAWHQGIVLLARYKFWELSSNWQHTQVAYAVWKEWVKDKTIEIDEELFADADFGMQPQGLLPVDPRLDFDHED